MITTLHIRRFSLFQVASFAAVVVLAARVFFLFIRFEWHVVGVHRFQIESSCLVFAFVGLCLTFARTFPTDSHNATEIPLSLRTWPILCCLALALYWPALFVGFLSDDYALLPHAAKWDVGPITKELFRPLPLVLWAILSKLHASPVVYHLLNVLLHGTNAYLAARLVAGWSQDRRAPQIAAAIVLTAPLAPEAVVWCAGIFDVLATTLILTTILTSRRYRIDGSAGTRVLFIVAAVAALMSKETAVVVPGLVFLDAWVRRPISRRLIIDLILVGGIVGAFGVFRIVSAHPADAAGVLTKYALQRALFTSFGDLAAPWSSDVAQRFLGIAALHGTVVLVLITLFFLVHCSKHTARGISAATTWILISIVPVFPFFFIGQDLQGSRYLYLGAIGWSALVALAVTNTMETLRLKVVPITLVMILVGVSVFETRVHIRAWTEAAALRGAVQQAIVSNPLVRQCREVRVKDLPDTTRGAYLFRVGAREALSISALSVSVGDEGGACSFRWDQDSLSFKPFRP